MLEDNDTYLNLSLKGEPQLGRRGLYRAIGASMDKRAAEMSLLWVLSMSDGTHDLLAIAERASLPFHTVREAADRLLEHELLAPGGAP